MKVVVQRTTAARVAVDGAPVGEITGPGMMLLVGVGTGDTEKDVEYIVDKVVHLRIFDDAEGKMNLDIKQVGGSILSVSQFTLYGDTRKGRRPNYMMAASPQNAQRLYNLLNDRLRDDGIQVETGQFGRMMEVTLTNQGPVTILIDSEKKL